MNRAVATDTSSMNEPVVRADAARCSACAVRRVCVSHDVDRTTLSHLETLIQRAKKLHRGETLYFSDHALHYLFAVRSGSLKTVMRSRDGDEQIVGVHGPGDAVGLDGLATGMHAFDAIALEDASVCLIPYDMLKQLCHDVPAIHQRLIEILGDQMVSHALLKVLCGLQPVEARVVTFLLECSRKNARRGHSPREFSLAMTRAEIGNYLGTTLETVSRIMSMLARDSLIEVKGRRILVPDPGRLEARVRAGDCVS